MSQATPPHSLVDRESPFRLPDDAVVVCHDAGAANIIVAGLAQVGINPTWRVLMRGPAATIWSHATGTTSDARDLDDLLQDASLLLTGTGWSSSLEHDARVKGATRSIPSVALVDHWVNYPQRFVRDGTTQLPDELWVSDEDAQAIAQREFDQVALRLVPNRYLASQVDEIGPLSEASASEVLYVAEPVRDDWAGSTPGEFQALDYFASRFDTLAVPRDAVVRLRPHPSDPPGKYDDWAHRTPLSVVIDDSPTLAEAMAHARWVVGTESAAMVVALAAGRTVWCSLPPWAPPCRLPQQGIIKLADQNSV